MRAFRRLVGIGLAVLICGQLHAQADIDDAQTLLQNFDSAWGNLRATLWRLHDVSPLYGRDARGRSLADDLNDNLLTDAVYGKVTTQRSIAIAALNQGNAIQAEQALNNTQSLISQQRAALERVYTYWRTLYALRFQREEWQQLQARYAQLHNIARDPDALELEAKFDQLIKANQMLSAIDVAGSLQQAYATERIAAIRGIDTTSDWLPRLTECPIAAEPTRGDENPHFARSTSNINDYYPPLANFANLEGNVVLKLRINANGCVVAAGIEHTSGIALLDDAALQWIETAVFSPAARAGQAISAETQIRVTFKQVTPK
jgi:TonB family protein